MFGNGWLLAGLYERLDGFVSPVVRQAIAFVELVIDQLFIHALRRVDDTVYPVGEFIASPVDHGLSATQVDRPATASGLGWLSLGFDVGQ
ncbi:hypothetical protein D3C71_1990720 [compost metagenome]